MYITAVMGPIKPFQLKDNFQICISSHLETTVNLYCYGFIGLYFNMFVACKMYFFFNDNLIFMPKTFFYLEYILIKKKSFRKWSIIKNGKTVFNGKKAKTIIERFNVIIGI